MEEVLVSNGWEMVHECASCGGGKQHYSNKAFKGFEVIIKPKALVFAIFKDNHMITGPNWGYQLADKLKEFVK